MRLQHTHDTDGPVRVTVSADGMPVFINIDESALYCSVDIVASDDSKAIWAGPTGFRGTGFGVEIGGRGVINSLRSGSYVSGGGSVVTAGGRGSVVSGGGSRGTVRATGRGSIAAGGSIVNAVTGNGARIVGKEPERTPEPGIHLTVPEGCVFDFKRCGPVNARKGAVVARGVDDAQARGWLEVKR